MTVVVATTRTRLGLSHQGACVVLSMLPIVLLWLLLVVLLLPLALQRYIGPTVAQFQKLFLWRILLVLRILLLLLMMILLLRIVW